jgi:hypothetical protein
MAHVRLALAFGIGDAHLFGLGSPSFAGGGVGLALGSPLFQLGPRTSPIAVAVRGGIDLIAGHLRTTSPGTLIMSVETDDYTAIGGRVTPLELSLSVAVSHDVALEVRGALGVAILAQALTAINGTALLPGGGGPIQCAPLFGPGGPPMDCDGKYHHHIYGSVDAAAGVRF